MGLSRGKRKLGEAIEKADEWVRVCMVVTKEGVRRQWDQDSAKRAPGQRKRPRTTSPLPLSLHFMYMYFYFL